MTPMHLFTKQVSPLRKAPLGQWVSGQVSGAGVAPATPVALAKSTAKTAAMVRLRMGLPVWLPRRHSQRPTTPAQQQAAALGRKRSPPPRPKSGPPGCASPAGQSAQGLYDRHALPTRLASRQTDPAGAEGRFAVDPARRLARVRGAGDSEGQQGREEDRGGRNADCC